MDVAILGAWWRLQDELCPQCGRPLPLHEDTPADAYRVGFRSCPAQEAIERAQADRRRRKLDEAAERDELQPDRWRQWLTWTDDEGEPPW